jgi:hypothetical protein
VATELFNTALAFASLMWISFAMKTAISCAQRGGSKIDSGTLPPEGALLRHTQHHDRPSYALMAFCQSIITLVAR